MCSSSCDCDDVSKRISSELNVTESGQPQSCRKCGELPFIILDKVHPECKTCFLESCNKKIRSTIGKSKLLRNNDAVLLAYSGGASSSALLDLIKCSIEYEGRREQKFRPSIVYIDTLVAKLGYSQMTEILKQKDQRLEDIKKLLKSTNSVYPDWPIYWTTLEMFTLPNPPYERYQPDSDLPYPLVEDINSINSFYAQLEQRDTTEKQKFIQEAVVKLVDEVAKKENFKFVFTASSSTQLANNLLVDVILGQGGIIHSVVGVCDKRLIVPIIRPMRDFTKKEIVFYLRARNLDYRVQTNFMTLEGQKSSIQKLTEGFLSKLNVDYPSTYSTLLRTGVKMHDESNQ